MKAKCDRCEREIRRRGTTWIHLSGKAEAARPFRHRATPRRGTVKATTTKRKR